MASLADSEAVFANRVAQLGFVSVAEALGNKGWTTYGNFAFASVSGLAQTADSEQRWNTDIATALLGTTFAADRRLAALRRL